MKYVGIKNYQEKKAAANAKGRRITVKVTDLCADDCIRHIELFHGNKDRYIKYYRYLGKTAEYAEKKIAKFLALKRKIKEEGYKSRKNPIKVTANGIRIDGSHRAAILYCMGVEEVEVLEVPIRMTKRLEEHLKEQRRAYC